jgi:complement component 1 Q subcomponent-binding protein
MIFALLQPSVPGAMSIDAVCQEGTFVVENVSFYKDSKLATELTAEADWKRRGLYIGPQFETLDLGLQEEFEKFLEERGINDSLALFVPEYAQHKEQKVRKLLFVSIFVS